MDIMGGWYQNSPPYPWTWAMVVFEYMPVGVFFLKFSNYSSHEISKSIHEPKRQGFVWAKVADLFFFIVVLWSFVLSNIFYGWDYVVKSLLLLLGPRIGISNGCLESIVCRVMREVFMFSWLDVSIHKDYLIFAYLTSFSGSPCKKL